MTSTSRFEPAGRRIGLDMSAAVTQGGGIGRYNRELVRALAGAPGPFQYRLFSVKPTAALPVADPIPKHPQFTYRQLPLTGQWLYRFWYRLRLPLPVQLATGRIDLFHSPDFVLPPVWGDVPTLLTVHDLSFLHYPEVYPPALVRYLNRVVPWSVARATHVLADSEATRTDLEQEWGVAPAKISVLYSGVSAAFRPEREPDQLAAVRGRYEIRDKPYMLAVGTLQPRKNYQMLVRAFCPVAASWPGQLLIAGGHGWLYDEMMAEVGRQGLEGRVRFLGFVPDADLPALYSQATLFLFPSLYEGFGLPALEAMACGVPALLADASCLPEVGGDAALMLPPGDETAWTAAMMRLLADNATRAHMVGAGFLQARRFTWTAAAARLLSIYQKLLEPTQANADKQSRS